MPELPAMIELLPGYEVTQWYGLLVPAGTPKEIIERLHKEMVRAIANPKVAQLSLPRHAARQQHTRRSSCLHQGREAKSGAR